MDITAQSSIAGSPAAPGAARVRLGFVRVAIGLVHALGLLWMYRAWSSST